jgi:hypothetical protein
MKNIWNKHAFKTRKIQKSYLRKYSYGDACRLSTKASGSDSLKQSGQEQEKEIDPTINPIERTDSTGELYEETGLQCEIGRIPRRKRQRKKK